MRAKILVTGATGNVGSRVVRELRDRGASVRAFVRDPDKAAAMLGGVEVAVGDFGDPGSVRAALEGAEGVFLACANDPRQVEYETGLIDAAKGTGVRRIVKLSALGAEVGSPIAFWDWHGRIEEHLRASGVPFVMLRPAFSMANLLGSAEGVRQAGALFVPAGGARVAMIDPADVAAAAAVALLEDGHEGRACTLTGPEAITFGRVAEDLSAATGQGVSFVAVPDAAARQALVGSGLPEFVAGQIVAVFGVLRRGGQDLTTDAVRALTGSGPRPFALFARDHAGLFRRAGDVEAGALAGSGP